MSQYLPNFSRNLKGKYNPELGFVSIKAGSDAYLLEDEINELQWIQSGSIANLIKHISNSGCFDIPNPNDPTRKGGLIELGTSKLNAFSINGFDTVFDGFISRINSSDDKPFVIQLTDPPLMGVRYDLVYLEFWFKELKQYDSIPKFGGFYNDSVDYSMIDGRMNLETTQRLQLQWAFRTYEDALYPDILNNNLTNITLNPQGPNGALNTNFKFTVNKDDKHLFEAGDGSTVAKQSLGTNDGKVYAIPMLLVRRLNCSGYNIKYNEDGGVNYVNDNSISGRPDDKFSNVIYVDAITDLRKQVLIGEDQLSNIFVTKDEFENYQLYVKNQIKTEVDSLRTDVDGMQDIVYTEIDKIEEEINALKSQVDNEIEVKLNELDVSLNGKINTLDVNLNKKIDGFITDQNEKYNNLEILVNSFNAYLTNFQQQFITTISDFNLNISTIKSNVRNLKYHVASLIPEGIDSWLDKYGLDIFHNSKLTPGSDIIDNIITCKDLKINTGYDFSKEYSVLQTISKADVPGQVGDTWVEKNNSYFIFKNTGANNLNIDLYSLTIDGVYTFGNSDKNKYVKTYFSGLTGTRISRTMRKTDFIQIMPLENHGAKVGEVGIVTDDLGFTVYNTGDSTCEFEWSIIDTRLIENNGRLKNIFIYDVNLTGDPGIIKTDEFGGEGYNVLISSIIVSNVSDLTGDVGEVNYHKISDTEVAIGNTGETTGYVKVIIFKDNVVLGETDAEKQTYLSKYNLAATNTLITAPGAAGIDAGFEISTGYSSSNNYCVMTTTIAGPDVGIIGGNWISKNNQKYIFRNTGSSTADVRLYTIKVDNIVCFSNADSQYYTPTYYNGLTGTRISRTMKTTDFIQITAVEDNTSVGETYIVTDNNGFTVYNTGLTGAQFEWAIIDTRTLINNGTLKNIEVHDVALNGQTGANVSESLTMDNYNVLISTPVISNISEFNNDTGKIGDITLKVNDKDSYTVYNSGAIFGKVKTIVFTLG